MTKVSVIVCVYNGEQYLRECLDSVVNQTLKDIGIICVDDGSTDSSLSILEEYAQKDKRIKVLKQENQGLSCGRNNALKIAVGKYIVFLDADDYLRNDAIDVIFNKMEQNNLDMLSYSGLNFDDSTRKMEINNYWEFTCLPKKFDKERYNYKKCKSFMHRLAVSSCLTAYRRNFLEDKNIYFPPHLCYEDNVFYLKALTQAKYCGIIKDKLYFRRIHSASITQNWNKHFSDYLKITEIVLEYLSNFDKKIFNNYRKSYLDRCVNLFNSFGKEEQFLYNDELLLLLEKYKYKVKIQMKNDKKNLEFYEDRFKMRFTKKQFIEKIFSVKNSPSKKYKVVRILGIKISIRRKKNGNNNQRRLY